MLSGVRDSGFSLVEAIFAIGLLGASLVTLAYTVSLCLSTDAFARHATLSSMHAAQKLEEMRAMPILAPVPEAVEFLDAAGNSVCGSAPCERAVYARYSSVGLFSGVAEAVVIQVRVRHLTTTSREAHVAVVRARVLE